MPSWCIHIAIASEYIKKHKNEIKDKEEFLKGTIDPDISDNKYESHYDNYKEKHNGISPFLKKEKVESDYWKGYFLHLVADDLFYNKIFKKETEYVENNDLSFYHDWECLNKDLIKTYKIEKLLTDRVKKNCEIVNGDPEYIDFTRVKNFIDGISEVAIEKQIEEININGNPII